MKIADGLKRRIRQSDEMYLGLDPVETHDHITVILKSQWLSGIEQNDHRSLFGTPYNDVDLDLLRKLSKLVTIGHTWSSQLCGPFLAASVPHANALESPTSCYHVFFHVHFKQTRYRDPSRVPDAHRFMMTSIGGESGLTISALYIYPIKSLREISIKLGTLTPQGLRYDRRFMLRQIKEDGTRKNMGCYHVPKMTRFVPEFASLDPSSSNTNDAIRVTFSPTSDDVESRTEILIPLEPDISTLTETTISMHGSPCLGYEVGEEYDKWFSECFGFDVELIYVGPNRREVLGNLSPNGPPGRAASASWMSTFTSHLPSIPFTSRSSEDSLHEQGLGLSDVAAILVVSETSLNHVKRLLPPDINPDIRKFRPNIVVRGANEEWIEDFWAELSIGVDGKRVFLTQNCNRCVSLNLDLDRGKFAEGEEGKVLARLAKDRRVDPAAKRSPVFGRYGFLERETAHGREIQVGESVEVVKVNAERTAFYWPHKIPS